MGLSLISPLLAVTLNWELLVVILEVAFALGMVIFVHELGHFAVAKWCGVKCEKFYLGFDIYGLKLFKYQWGETEYGIGILPLGGYVKMLGQDDNPARAAEERERSQLKNAAGEPNLADVAATARVAAGGSGNVLDPRSYLAKSVPQRMAIISAGVVMNIIFAFVCAAWAYQLGVPETVCGVSAVMPGETAWRADLQPGDRVLQIEDYQGPLRFRDLMSAVALGNLTEGVDFLIEREGVKEPFWVNLKPQTSKGKLLPTIGVASPLSTTLEQNPIVDGGTPAAETGKFRVGDTIVAIDGVPVKSYADVLATLTRRAHETLTITVARKAEETADAAATRRREDISVKPQIRRTLGLVMTMGEITAIQNGSPAAEAGLRVGDRIETIDGETPGDPLRLPDVLRGRAGQTVKLAVARTDDSGKTQTIEKQIPLRERPWPEESFVPKNPVAVPALGLTYKVLAKVREVEAGSPAAAVKLTKDGEPTERALLAAGDEIVEAAIVFPELSEDELKRRALDKSQFWVPKAPEPLEISAEKPNWPFLITMLQQLPDGTKVTLTLKDGRSGTLVAAPAQDWYYFDRGLRYGSDTMIIKAGDFQEALVLGGRETGDSLLMVYKFLSRIGTQVSPFAFGGPVTIAQAAGGAAYEGLSSLLLFVTLLSANLAVINFLPIPLLDGGHMVFLILEGILRRPVSEKVVVAFHYAGFVFLISLMLFVLSLDVGLISRTN